MFASIPGGGPYTSSLSECCCQSDQNQSPSADFATGVFKHRSAIIRNGSEACFKQRNITGGLNLQENAYYSYWYTDSQHPLLTVAVSRYRRFNDGEDLSTQSQHGSGVLHSDSRCVLSEQNQEIGQKTRKVESESVWITLQGTETKKHRHEIAELSHGQIRRTNLQQKRHHKAYCIETPSYCKLAVMLIMTCIDNLVPII